MKKSFARLALAASAASLVFAGAAPAAAARRPWMNRSLSPDARAAMVVGRMSEDEKLTLVLGYFGANDEGRKYTPAREARLGSAGYVPGIPRLGIPPQWQTDAGIGVATQGSAAEKRERTALPSGLATAATWNPDLAYRGGAMIGAEAFASGFNVMLAGGVNLLRDPRNGRNFEYGGEDPLLAGIMVGAQMAGIQSNAVVSTVKHYAVNDQETGRGILDARIDPDQARMSDLLAFQIAIERGQPGSVMCAYNQVNGAFSCENDWLLNQVLKRDWGFKGFVMSDWGATHSTERAANGGLDQQSGYPFDKRPWFGAPLKAALAAGRVPRQRLDDMATRILRAMFAVGAVDRVARPGAIDYSAHEAVSGADAEQGAVLLKNRGSILPLGPDVRRIVLIGGHADKGVLSGGGSSQVYPRGGNAVPGLKPTGWPGPVVYYPSSPLKAIAALAPQAKISFVDGSDPAAAARAAATADVALVFANQWTSESIDTSLTLPDGQDALIEAVAAANPRTIAILQTGGPVLMPWIDRVASVLEAWYPGTRGGEAIANLLFGKVDPSGRLPATFPRDESQLVRPQLDGIGLPRDQGFAVTYSEGATVGYKYYDARNLQPLFPFGHGLSYTSFGYSGLQAANRNGELIVSFRVRNTGRRRGMDVPQVYVGPVGGAGWEAPKRLAGFKKVDLAPGGETIVTIKVDPRLLALFKGGQWRQAAGRYQVMLGASSRDIRQTVSIRLPARRLPVSYRP
jgi:beta-glucosidase